MSKKFGIKESFKGDEASKAFLLVLLLPYQLEGDTNSLDPFVTVYMLGIKSLL